MHSDEMAEAKSNDSACPTARELDLMKRGRVGLDRKSVAKLAQYLENIDSERSCAIKLLQKFEHNIWSEKLYMMDEVFLPDYFGFHQHVEGEIGEQQIVYLNDNVVMCRMEGNMWAVAFKGVKIEVTIDNAFQAYVVFNALGIKYTLSTLMTQH